MARKYIYLCILYIGAKLMRCLLTGTPTLLMDGTFGSEPIKAKLSKISLFNNNFGFLMCVFGISGENPVLRHKNLIGLIILSAFIVM